MGLKESGLRGSLRNVSVGIDAIPDSVVYHFDATSIDESDSSSINSWECGVTGNSITGTATYRESALNGNPSLEFDGVDDDLSNTTDFSNVEPPYTVFVVAETNNMDSRQGITGAAENFSHHVSIRDENWQLARSGQTITGSSDGSVQLLTTQEQDGSVFLRENGTQTASETDSTETFDAMSVGSLKRDDDNYFDGFISHVEIHDETLSLEQVEDRESELASKFDVNL